MPIAIAVNGFWKTLVKFNRLEPSLMRARLIPRHLYVIARVPFQVSGQHVPRPEGEEAMQRLGSCQMEFPFFWSHQDACRSRV